MLGSTLTLSIQHRIREVLSLPFVEWVRKTRGGISCSSSGFIFGWLCIEIGIFAVKLGLYYQILKPSGLRNVVL